MSAAPIPCPFCGKHPEVDHGETGATIECVNAACWGPSVFADHEDHSDGYDLAVAMWNARSPLGFPAALFETDDAAIERMAEAWWNRHATIPWATYMGSHPEQKGFYLESMAAAVKAVRP